MACSSPLPFMALAPVHRPTGAAAVVPLLNVRSTVRVRQITAHNFREEVAMIGSLIRAFPFVAVDTEYPGTVHRPARKDDLTAEQRYALVKANVDELHLLQLGLTLCDGRGRLPVGLDDARGGHGGPVEYAWQVNFADYDAARGDRGASKSIAFLRAQGFDFDSALALGVTAQDFARELDRHGIVDLGGSGGRVTWITFGGLYDAAYLLKLVTGGQPLPDAKVDFLVALGAKIFDVKYMASVHEIQGSLRAVTRKLGVPPLSPAMHLAGPNSVVTCRTFMELRARQRLRFPWGNACYLFDALEIDGLQDDGAGGDDPAAEFNSFLPWRNEL